jgi:hypothetical protein
VWAKNDQGFYNSLTSRRWLSYITDPRKPSSVDAVCLIENQENCAAPATPLPEPSSLQSGLLYKNNLADKNCVIKDNQAQCVSESRDALCLLAVESFNPNLITIVKDDLLATYSPKIFDRHAICSAYDSALIKVGTAIKLKTAINLRSTPAGGLVTTVPSGQVLDILDFEIRNPSTKEHYYKINYNGSIGYIFAGDKTNYSSWAVVNNTVANPSVVAKIGQTVQIVNSSGINLRVTPAGVLIKAIPKLTQLQVLDVVIQGSENKTYYKVKYGNSTGYIYTGILLPQSTVSSWTKIIK